jgi:hypothetical protein
MHIGCRWQNQKERRSRRRWDDNIKMDVRVVGWGGMYWIHLARDRDQWRAVLNTVKNLRVPSNVWKFLNSWRTRLLGFSQVVDHLTIPSVTKIIQGRAIAEAVSRWFPTAAARVQFRVWSSGICGGQSGVGAGFLRVLRFPLPVIAQISPSSHSKWPTCRVDPVWTPPPTMQIKKKN